MKSQSHEGTEFRFNDDGTLDEVVVTHCGEVVLHLEQMDDGAWWMGVGTGEGYAHVNLFTKSRRGPAPTIHATAEFQTVGAK